MSLTNTQPSAPKCAQMPVRTSLWRRMLGANDEHPQGMTSRTVRLGHYFVEVPNAQCRLACDLHLSEREKQALLMFACGMSSHEAAARLGITRNTVETYRRRILEKTGAKNTAEATAIATAWALGARIWEADMQDDRALCA